MSIPVQTKINQLNNDPSLKNGMLIPSQGFSYQTGVDPVTSYSKPDPLYDKYLTQTNWDSLGNTLVRGGMKFVLSAPELAGNMWEFTDSNRDWDNALSEWARTAKEEVDTRFPEYSKYFEEGFNPGDVDWWFRNGDSIIESAGYMVTGAAVGRGLVGIAKLMGATANASKAIGTVGSALLMNYGEGVQMAGSRYRELLDAGVSKEEAAKAAKSIVEKNAAHLPLQLLESRLLLKGLDGTRAFSSLGVKASLKDAAMQFGQEGFEEWNQGFIEEEAVRSAKLAEGKIADDNSTWAQRRAKYAFSDDALTQTLIGGFGGGATQVVTDAVRNLDPKYREQKQKALDTISSNYANIIDITAKLSEIQKKKEVAAQEKDEIEYDHLNQEQALEVAISNAKNGTYEQFLNTFKAFSNMTEAEATEKGLTKQEIAKMSAVLEPMFARVEKMYGRTQAEFRGLAGSEFVDELVKTAYLAEASTNTSNRYYDAAKAIETKVANSNAATGGATKSRINAGINKFLAAKLLYEVHSKNATKGEAYAHLAKRAEAEMKRYEKEFSEMEADAKENNPELYVNGKLDYSSPSTDYEMLDAYYKGMKNQFLGEYYRATYEKVSDKKYIKKVQKEAAEKKKAEETAAKTEEKEQVVEPIVTHFNEVAKGVVFETPEAKEEAKSTLVSQYKSLQSTEAYQKLSKNEKAKIDRQFRNAVRSVEKSTTQDRIESRNKRVKAIDKKIAQLQKLKKTAKLNKYKNREKNDEVDRTIEALEAERKTLNTETALLNKVTVQSVHESESKDNMSYFQAAYKKFVKSLKIQTNEELAGAYDKIQDDLFMARLELRKLLSPNTPFLKKLFGKKNPINQDDVNVVKLVIASNEAKLLAVEEELLAREIKEEKPAIILEANTETGRYAARSAALEEAFKNNVVEDISEDGRTITLRGNTYTIPYPAGLLSTFSVDAKGNYISVTLTNEEGKEVTVRNKRIVEELAFALTAIEVIQRENRKTEVVSISQVDTTLLQVNQNVDEQADAKKKDAIQAKIDEAERDLQELEEIAYQLALTKDNDFAELRAIGVSKKEAETLVANSTENKQLKEVNKLITKVKNHIKTLQKEQAKPAQGKKTRTKKNESTSITRKPAVEVAGEVSGQDVGGENEDTSGVSEDAAEGEVTEEGQTEITHEFVSDVIDQNEEDLEDGAEFVPSDKTMHTSMSSEESDFDGVGIRQKDDPATFGYLGQEYTKVELPNGTYTYEDVVDADGNPVIIAAEDSALNDYDFFKPGDDIEIVLDMDYARKNNIPVDEANLYRIPFGIRRPGQPVTAWVHSFTSPVSTQGIDPTISRLIQPKAREAAQNKLLALRQQLFEATAGGKVVSAKVAYKTTGYSLVTEAKPTIEQIGINGKVADDVDFGYAINNQVVSMGGALPVSTAGRRDENGALIYPEGALLVMVPGYSKDRGGATLLQPYYAQAGQITDSDIEVIMHVLGKGKPSDAWAGTGFEVANLDEFLSYYFYNGKNSQKVYVGMETENGIKTRYMYTFSTGKDGAWDTNSRIRLWTNSTAKPITAEEIEAAKEFLGGLYYNFPRKTKSYPKFTLKEGNMVYEGSTDYRTHIAGKTATIIHGKPIPGTNKKQFFAQPIIGINIPSEASPKIENKVVGGMKIIARKKGDAQATPVQEKSVPVVKESTRELSLEEKLADVERKRQEDLANIYDNTSNPFSEELNWIVDKSQKGDSNYSVQNALTSETRAGLVKKINAQYDAEIAKLKGETTTKTAQTIAVANASPTMTSFAEPVLGFKDEVITAIKGDPNITMFTLMEAMPDISKKEAVKKAYQAYKRETPSGNVSTFIKELMTALRKADALTATVPLSSRNISNVVALNKVNSSKEAIYDLLTSTEDEQFNSDMRSLLSKMGDFKVVTLDVESPFYALADSSTDTIFLFSRNIATSPRELATILGHEVVHLATAQAIESPSTAAEEKFSKNMKKAFAQAKAKLGKEAGANVKEFAAEFFSNSAFRESLDAKVKTGFVETILNWIKELFGISTSIEESVRNYTNDFLADFKGYNRKGYESLDPLGKEYAANGFSLIQADSLIASLTGSMIIDIKANVLSVSALKDNVRELLTDAIAYADNPVLIENILNKPEFFDVVFNDVKTNVSKFNLGFDEREAWQLETRFEVSPWDSTSVQVKQFLATIPEVIYDTEEKALVVYKNELGLTTYKNPHALHSNLAETIAGKDVMETLAFLSGENQFGIVYDPVKAYIYYTLLEYQTNGDLAQRQLVNAFITDFKKYKIEYTSTRHTEEVQVFNGEVIVDEQGVPIKKTKFKVFDSNRSRSGNFLQQWYNGFKSKMVRDDKIDRQKAANLLTQFDRVADGLSSAVPEVYDNAVTEVYKILNEFGINISRDTIVLATTEPKKVNRRYNVDTLKTAARYVLRTATLADQKDGELAFNNPFEKEVDNLLKIAAFEVQTNSSSFSALHRTEGGKNLYGITNNNMLFTIEKKLKENNVIIDQLLQDPFTQDSLLLKEIVNGGSFSIKILTDYVNLKGEAAGFREITPQERFLNRLAEFNNKGDVTTNIMFPTLESKPVIPILRVPRIKVRMENGRLNSEALELVFNVFLAEHKRIQSVKDDHKNADPEDMYETYHFGRKADGTKDYSKGRGLKFHFIQSLNQAEVLGVKLADLTAEEVSEYKSEILDVLNNAVKHEINVVTSKLIKVGIATASKGTVSIKKEFKDSDAMNKIAKHSGVEKATDSDYIANFTVNNLVRIADIYQVFGGDIAYTKDHVDKSKRLAMLIAPGANLDVVRNEITVMPIKDVNVSSPMVNNFVQVLEYINAKYKSKGVQINIEEAIQPILKIKATDGQTWVGTDYKLNELDSLGRLTDHILNMVDAVLMEEDLAPEGYPLGTSKIVYANRVWDGKRFAELYIKTSTNTAVPGVHKQEILDMTKSADLVSYQSAIKSGMSGIDSNKVSTVPADGLLLQQETTYHGDDTSITALSQARRMLTEGFRDPVFSSITFDFYGEKMNAETFRNKFQQLHISTVEAEWKKMQEDLGIVFNNGSYRVTDMNKVQKALLQSGRLNEVEEEMLKVENGEFVVPLFFSTASERFESLLFSIVSNRIMSLEQNGTSFVQVSTQGFSNLGDTKIFDTAELSEDILNKIEWLSEEAKQDIMASNSGLRDMYFDGNKMLPAKVVLPNIYKQYFTAGQKVTPEQLKEAGLDKIFLMRSPYQLGSGFAAEIAGFFPSALGEIIAVPNEAMSRIGFDFDVDKLFAYVHAAEMTKTGIKKVEYLSKPEDVDARYAAYVQARIFDALDDFDVLEEEQQRLINLFKDNVSEIIESRVSSTMGSSIADAQTSVYQAISKIKGPAYKQMMTVIKDRSIGIAAREAELNRIIGELSKDNRYSVKDLNAVSIEYANFVNLVNTKNQYKDEFREAFEETEAPALRKRFTAYKRERLTKIALESNLVGSMFMTKEDFALLSVEEQNSKYARGNAILDMFLEVYSKPEIMVKLMNVNSEAPIQDAVEKLGRKLQMESPINPAEQDRLFAVNKDSKTGIAIASTWVTFQEVLQHNKVKLKVYEQTADGVELVNAGVKFLNKKGRPYIDVDSISNAENKNNIKQVEANMNKGYEGVGLYSIKTRGINQDLVSKVMMVLQTSTVDNVKNQTMSPANLNDFTLPLAMYLASVGIDDFDLMVAFLTQPAVLKYTEHRNAGYSHANAIKYLYADYAKKVTSRKGNPVRKESSAKDIKAFSYEEMASLIKQEEEAILNPDSLDINYFNQQLEIVNKLDNYMQSATTLGRAASQANFDTKKLGKNYHDVKNRKEGYDNITSNETFVNLGKIFEGNVLGAYYQRGVIPASTMFNTKQLLPYGYLLFDSVYEKYQANVATNNGRFDEKGRRDFHKEIMKFIASYDNGISDPSMRRDLIINLPKQVQELKLKYPNNVFLSRVDIDLKGLNGKPYSTITFKRTGLDVNEIKYVVDSFSELLDNPETADVAEDMVRYTLLFHGISQASNSMITVVPPAYMLSTYYGDRYKSADFVSQMNNFEVADRFFDQYAAHNPNKFHFKAHKVNPNNPASVVLSTAQAEVEISPEVKVIPDFIQVNYKGKRYAAKKMQIGFDAIEYVILNPRGDGEISEYSFDGSDSVLRKKVSEGFTPTVAIGAPISNPLTENTAERVENKTPLVAFSGKPSEYTNHSGGAYGADTLWDIIGRGYGITNNVHYRDAKNQLLSKALRSINASVTVLTKEQMQAARQEVERLLGEKYPDTLEGNLKVRNYYQVANSDAVFAVAKLDSPVRDPSKKDNTTDLGKSVKSYKFNAVKGGTNVAVQLAIKLKKPVHVWDITSEKWVTYDYDAQAFVPAATPVLTRNYAGIGSRDIENYSILNKQTQKWEPRKEYVGDEKAKKAEQAIREVYELTFGTIQENKQAEQEYEEKPPWDETPAEKTLNIYYGTGENAELSNLYPRPFTFMGINFKSVEHAYQHAKGEFYNTYAIDPSSSVTPQELDAILQAHLKEILNAKTGAQAKALGRKDIGIEFEQEMWDAASSDIMKELLFNSFVQNPKALQALLATGNAKLTHTQDKGKWKTEFPRLLMELREDLRNESKKETKETSQAAEPIEGLSFVPLNAEQANAVKAMQDFLADTSKNSPAWFTLEGKAGTGKTSIMAGVLEPYLKEGAPRKNIIIGALSHKAKSVLSEKLRAQFPKGRFTGGSIAGLLGMIMDVETGEFKVDKSMYGKEAPIESADIVVIDEASMVNEEALELIQELSPARTKIIFLGDRGQLPPIRRGEDASDKISPIFDAPAKASLVERVRQGEESPILPFADYFWNNSESDNSVLNPVPAEAMQDRVTEEGSIVFSNNYGNVLPFIFNEFKKAVERNNPNQIKVVAYKNETRKDLNRQVREAVFGNGASEQIMKGELLMFMDNFKLSAYEKIDNSEEVQVLEVADSSSNGYKTKYVKTTAVYTTGENISLHILATESIPAFNNALNALKQEALKHPKGSNPAKDAWRNYYKLKESFPNVDYAYAVTSHKAQGSTYETVVVDGRDIMSVTKTNNKTKSRSMYTALTRASSTAIVIGGKVPGNPDNVSAALNTKRAILNEEKQIAKVYIEETVASDDVKNKLKAQLAAAKTTEEVGEVIKKVCNL